MPFLIFGGEPPHLDGLVTPPRPALHHGPRLPRQPLRLLGGRLVHGPATETTVQAPQRLPEGSRLAMPLRKILRLPEEMGPAPLDTVCEAPVGPPPVADDDPVEAFYQYLLQDLLALLFRIAINVSLPVVKAQVQCRARATLGVFLEIW